MSKGERKRLHSLSFVDGDRAHLTLTIVVMFLTRSYTTPMDTPIYKVFIALDSNMIPSHDFWSTIEEILFYFLFPF